jgi:penicillin amidase
LFLYLYYSIPKYSGELKAPFIRNEVEIYWDKVGIPHIFAREEGDAYFTLGYIHAMERLFQMEIYRRQAKGALSEIFGEKTLRYDKFYKALNLGETAEQEEFIMEPELKKIVQMYVDGINYYIKKNEKLLSPEFLFLKIQPELWTVRDVILVMKLMSWEFSFNFETKKVVWKLSQKLNNYNELLQEDKDYQVFSRADEISESKVDNYLNILSEGLASNAWVVDGELSDDGSVIIANDTHTGAMMPSLWYISHICINGSHLIGASIPGMPFFLVGRNNDIGWGITALPADVQDVSISDKIVGDEAKLHKKIDKIVVKNKGVVLVDVYSNDYLRYIKGVNDNSFGGHSYELMWTGFVPGENLKALYMLNKARSWEGFINALSKITSPPLNFIYGDKRGNIGYYAAGLIPKRKIEISMKPYYAKQKWDGWLPEGEKVLNYNPANHYIVSANDKISQSSTSNLYGIDWIGSFRALRIKKLLSEKKKFSLNDFKAFQMDVKSEIAAIIIPYIDLIPKNLLNSESAKLREIIIKWDRNVDDSLGAAAFEVFFTYFTKNTFEDEMGEDLYYDYINYLSKGRYAGTIKIINERNNHWFDNIKTAIREDRDTIIAKSLNDAYEYLVKNYGKEIINCKWSLLNRIHFYNPLAENWLMRRLFIRKSLGSKGGIDTIRVANFSMDNNYYVKVIPSLRFVSKLNNMGNTYLLVIPGQSGHPLSKYYDNQLELWENGDLNIIRVRQKDIKDYSIGEIKLMPVNR